MYIANDYDDDDDVDADLMMNKMMKFSKPGLMLRLHPSQTSCAFSFCNE